MIESLSSAPAPQLSFKTRAASHSASLGRPASLTPASLLPPSPPTPTTPPPLVPCSRPSSPPLRHPHRALPGRFPPPKLDPITPNAGSSSNEPRPASQFSTGLGVAPFASPSIGHLAFERRSTFPQATSSSASHGAIPRTTPAPASASAQFDVVTSQTAFGQPLSSGMPGWSPTAPEKRSALHMGDGFAAAPVDGTALQETSFKRQRQDAERRAIAERAYSAPRPVPTGTV